MTGRYEPPRPSPLEGMTDEQKEHEAMKLVNVLDKLTRYFISKVTYLYHIRLLVFQTHCGRINEKQMCGTLLYHTQAAYIHL